MTTTTAPPTQPGPMLQSWALAVRDVGFPIVISFVLLYHVVFRVPALIDEATARMAAAVREVGAAHDAALQRAMDRLSAEMRNR